MVNCCVLGCKSRSERKEENITYHRFPNEPSLRKKWIECTGRIDWQPSRHSRICSKHFENGCFRLKKYKTILNERSLPTLFIHALAQPSQIDEKQPSTSKCQALVMDTEAKDPMPDNSLMITDDSTISLPCEDIAMEIEIESTMIRKIEITPRKKKLMKQLQRKTVIGEYSKKKLAALRSKTWRLEKKTAELRLVIQELKARSLRRSQQ